MSQSRDAMKQHNRRDCAEPLRQAAEAVEFITQVDWVLATPLERALAEAARASLEFLSESLSRQPYMPTDAVCFTPQKLRGPLHSIVDPLSDLFVNLEMVKRGMRRVVEEDAAQVAIRKIQQEFGLMPPAPGESLETPIIRFVLELGRLNAPSGAHSSAPEPEPEKDILRMYLPDGSLIAELPIEHDSDYMKGVRSDAEVCGCRIRYEVIDPSGDIIDEGEV